MDAPENVKKSRARKPPKPTDISMGYQRIDLVAGLTSSPPIYNLNAPNDPSCSSSVWKQGIRFLYNAETGECIPHWYGCELCKDVFNVYLPDGNGKLKRHVIIGSL